jgi:hypothetical protein
MRNSYRRLLFVCVFLLGASCLKPWRNFDAYPPPAAPDYCRAENWAALPDKNDSADLVPRNSGLCEDQAHALVDVFFIHPTTYYRNRSWNADVGDKKLNDFTDRTTIKMQASVYNESGCVYAPRYRQATLYSFMDKVGNRAKALDLAYQDVRQAFQYYLDHFNRGRPVIIASHSQGTYHAIRLVKEFFEPDSALYQKLVGAYLIGGPVPKNCFARIPASDSASQTGCYVAWNTVARGRAAREPGLECVNPLSWKRDTAYVPAEMNRGGVPKSFDRIDTAVVGAQCSGNRALWVDKPRVRGYPALGGSYHLVDYSLFYLNIRENVKARVQAYLKKNSP